MSTPQPGDPDWTWTRPQRRVLVVVLIALCITMAYRLVRDRAYVADPQPSYPARFEELADRIDPNTADLPTLAALPSIGEKRARDIVDYREQRRAAFPDAPAFTSVEDLLRIKGIGAAMIETLRPYLSFPTEPGEPRRATTRTTGG